MCQLYSLQCSGKLVWTNTWIKRKFRYYHKEFLQILTPKKCWAGARNMIGARIKNWDWIKTGDLIKTRAEINIGARIKTVARTNNGTRIKTEA